MQRYALQCCEQLLGQMVDVGVWYPDCKGRVATEVWLDKAMFVEAQGRCAECGHQGVGTSRY